MNPRQRIQAASLFAMRCQRAAAFTTTELLVAITISVVILLMAASAFRLVSSTIGLATRLSAENNLMRAGFLAVLDDADFWHSHANPDPPFNKGWTSDAVASGFGARKRHMAPVRFWGTTAPDAPTVPGSLSADAIANHPLPNPNVLLAHDPRTWYRNHIWADQRPQENWRDSDWNNRRGWQAPGGWSPRLLYGPYHLCQATDMRFLDNFSATYGLQKSDYGLDNLNLAENQMRPHLMFKLFQRLGAFAVVQYLPNGNPMIMMDSVGILPHAGSDPLGGQTNHPFQTGNLRDFNWAIYPRKNEPADTTAQSGLSFLQNQKMWTIKPVPNREDRMDYMPEDNSPSYEDYFVGRESCEGNNSNEEASPMRALIFATGSYINRAGDVGLQPEFTSETVRLPYNPTDHVRLVAGNVLDLTSRPKDQPLLRTTILRFQRVAGSDLAVKRVIIESPQTGKRIELKFSTTSTNYRGARMHWSAVRSGAMGDRYVW